MIKVSILEVVSLMHYAHLISISSPLAPYSNTETESWKSSVFVHALKGILNTAGHSVLPPLLRAIILRISKFHGRQRGTFWDADCSLPL